MSRSFIRIKKISSQNYLFIVRFSEKKLKKSHNVPLFLWATAPFIPTQYKNKLIFQKLDTLS